MASNNYRFDLSDRLIHFFRDIDTSSGSAPSMPEHFAFNSFVEGEKYPALFLLRSAIRMHRLWATWSVRKNVRTIYGPRPAVCFSEMPLAAFLESSRKREAEDKKMSSYGLTFNKLLLHDRGATPVIYGLTNRHAQIPNGKDGGPRHINEELLPLEEQYRYVAYAPTSNVRVDWTHEREWRWPLVGNFEKIESELEEYGVISDAHDIPGLDIASKKLVGIGVIVKTKKEAKYVTHDILTLIDRSKVGRYHFHHVLVTDLLPPTEELYDPVKVQEATGKATIEFDEHFDYSKTEENQAEMEFHAWVTAVEKKASPPRRGQQGGCWLWLLDNTHPFVRCLLQSGRITVNKEGRYLAHLNEFDDSRCVLQRQEMAQEVAVAVRKQHGISCDYFSVMGKYGVDDVSFDVGDDFLENRAFYNINF
jgi:hypothetical protein